MIENVIDDLRKRYLFILESSIEIMDENITHLIIDEINLFWESNKGKVELILNYYCTPFDTFFFTGATHLGVKDREHYPFVSIGKYHIMDDPLYSYVNTFNSNKEWVNFNDRMKEEVAVTIEDNIRILNECHPNILLLPLRSLFVDNNKKFFDHADSVIIGMFNDIKSIEEYHRLDGIEEIVDALNDEVKNSISFLNTDKQDDSIIDRFNNYKKEINYIPEEIKENDNQLFLFSMRGFITQAISILVISRSFNFVPYVRSSVVYRYLILLSPIYENDNDEMRLITLLCLAHMIYYNFKMEKFDSIGFKEYNELLISSDFSNQVICSIDTNENNWFKKSFLEVESIIKSKLEELYNRI